MEDFKNKKNMPNNGMKNTSSKGNNPQNPNKQMPGERHENRGKHTEGQEKYPSHMEKSYSSSKSGDICKGCNCRKSECECGGK